MRRLLPLSIAAACAGCTLVVVTSPLPSVQSLGAMNPHCLAGCSTATSAGAAASAAASAAANVPAPPASAAP